LRHPGLKRRVRHCVAASSAAKASIDQRVFSSPLDARVWKILEMPLKRSRALAGHPSLLLEVEINASVRSRVYTKTSFSRPPTGSILMSGTGTAHDARTRNQKDLRGFSILTERQAKHRN
jgi:hypothetical protein